MSSPTAAIFPAITRTSARKEASPLTTVPPWESLVWGEKKVTEVSVSVEVEAEVEVKKKARSIGEKTASFIFSCQPTFSSRSGASSACEKKRRARRSEETRRKRGARRDSRRGHMMTGTSLATIELPLDLDALKK